MRVSCAAFRPRVRDWDEAADSKREVQQRAAKRQLSDSVLAVPIVLSMSTSRRCGGQVISDTTIDSRAAIFRS
jgi:hypothetical protein